MSNRKKFIIVFKDTVATGFAQAAAVFEPTKFVGVAIQTSGIFTKPLPEVLHNLSRMPHERGVGVVGIIVPGESSVFFTGNRVVSDGSKWCLVEELCAVHEAPVEFIQEK
jgi:hypothetical protein